jgi:hypothetical protein
LALSSTAQSLLREDYRTWNNGSHQPTVVTYSFATQGGGFEDVGGNSVPFSPQHQTMFRMALNAWESVSGLHFVEMPDVFGGEGVDIRVRLGWTAGGSYTASSPAGGGDISLTDRYANTSVAPGSDGYASMLLTIGYALGFNSVSDSLFRETVMSAYNASNPKATGLGSADLEAVRYVYGTQEAEDALHVRWSWDTALNGLRHDGDNSNQTMTGGDRRDLMFAWGGDDVLTGNDGNDLLAAGGGTNTVTGGFGIDTLRTEHFRSETSITGLRSHNENSWSDVPQHTAYRGTLAGPGESTAFYGIEVIEYADGRRVYDENDPVAQVMRLYQAALGRQPDAAGREDGTAALMSGHSLASLASNFLDSPEFLARFGRPDDTGFIHRAYEQALGRQADAEGLAFWQGKLAGGMGRAELLTGFSESAENRGLTAPLLANGLWDADDHAVEAARLYQAVLGRLPEQAGLRFWIDYLDTGATLSAAAARFAESPEFQARFAASDDASLIRVVYANTLGRAPEEAGFSFWMDKLAQGISRGDMITGFSESPEFIQHHIGMLETGITFA